MNDAQQAIEVGLGHRAHSVWHADAGEAFSRAFSDSRGDETLAARESGDGGKQGLEHGLGRRQHSAISTLKLNELVQFLGEPLKGDLSHPNLSLVCVEAAKVEAPVAPSSPTTGRGGEVASLCDDCAWEACWLASACARRMPGVIDPEPACSDLAPADQTGVAECPAVPDRLVAAGRRDDPFADASPCRASVFPAGASGTLEPGRAGGLLQPGPFIAGVESSALSAASSITAGMRC